ncbi:MAG: hypothetical protein NC201_07225 [Prevotella sp.]|nr:hypothetical protein [Bacteroides sp.]MCM1367021.1 hypothetical protein [Prevotella sp.]MCM1436708.1 hypothetical protein [Prevotella sp.]
MKKEENQASPALVVMLTRNDRTVLNAADVYAEGNKSGALYWGMKEEELPLDEMKALYSQMRKDGKRTVLEVVSYDEAGGLAGARMASECGCDIMMGSKFYESIMMYCRERGIKYMPFVGRVEDRPSVLRGTVEEIVSEAKEVVSRGADGIDLLGYRYEGDAVSLIKEVVKEVQAPVCVAGSVDCYKRLDEVRESGTWSFTIGSAFFEHRFGDKIDEQIDNVISHIGG